MAEALKARYRLAGVIARAKDDASRPASEALIDELARVSDVVITAIGD